MAKAYEIRFEQIIGDPQIIFCNNVLTFEKLEIEAMKIQEKALRIRDPNRESHHTSDL